MPHKKKEKTKEERFAEAQALIAKQSEGAERIFQQGKEIPRPTPQKRFIAEAGGQREVSEEEFKREVEERKILAEGGRKAFQPIPEEQIPQPEEIPTEAIQIKGKKLPFASELAETSLGKAIATSKLLEEADFLKLQELTADMVTTGQTPEQITEDPAMQNLLRLNLSNRDFEILARGEANISALSQTMEGLPIVGGRVRAGGISISISDLTGRSPSAKVDDLIALLKDEGRFLQEAKSLGLINEVEEHKNKILDLESKIKLIAIQSPDLLEEPEKIDNIKGQIGTIKQQNLDLNWFS